jgi:hypothetical protein
MVAKIFEVLNDYSLELLDNDNLPDDLMTCNMQLVGGKNHPVNEYYNQHDELVYIKVWPTNKSFDEYVSGLQYM